MRTRACTMLQLSYLEYFSKVNFEKNLTLEIFNFDFLNFDFDYSDFDILDFDFEYFQLHYLLYSQTGHMDGIWPSVCFS